MAENKNKKSSWAPAQRIAQRSRTTRNKARAKARATRKRAPQKLVFTDYGTTVHPRRLARLNRRYAARKAGKVAVRR